MVILCLILWLLEAADSLNKGQNPSPSLTQRQTKPTYSASFTLKGPADFNFIFVFGFWLTIVIRHKFQYAILQTFPPKGFTFCFLCLVLCPTYGFWLDNLFKQIDRMLKIHRLSTLQGHFKVNRTKEVIKELKHPYRHYA